MFSKEYAAEIARNYEARRARWQAVWQAQDGGALAPLKKSLLEEKLRETEETLARCTPDEAEALRYLLGAMPLPDFVDYPASLYLAFAKHAVWLWHDGPFAGRVPERVFTNYVLHYRVNNEDIADVRGLFCDRLQDIAAKDRPMADVVRDVNYWCAREGTYRSTDIRTQNPATMLRTAIGRCGEESTFAATALRSIGIPARQVYAPWWSHCDDNHAWVEVWCDGEWHFFGACEPEEALDRGWFVGPASRAMMVHSRWFSLEAPAGEPAGTKGAVMLLSETARYADAAHLTVHVRDEADTPVPGAPVRFCVVNGASFAPIARVTADETGTARLLTGRGDLYVSVGTPEGQWGDAYVTVGDGAELTLTVRAAAPRAGDWQETEFRAPTRGVRCDAPLPADVQKTGDEKLAAAAAHRQEKSTRLTDERLLDRALSRFAGAARAEAEKLLRGARGNEGELIRFLEWDASGLAPDGWLREDAWKLALLRTLREKDTWDVKAEVLIDCAAAALPWAGSMPDELFFESVMCPRVATELLRPERLFLSRCLPEPLRAELRAAPARLYELVCGAVSTDGALGYPRVSYSAHGALRGGLADALSARILCVNLYRALGIPARIDPLTGDVEYAGHGTFVTPARRAAEDAALTLCFAGGLRPTDWEHYAIEHYTDGAFERVGLWHVLQNAGEQETLTLRLAPGTYRAVTSNRLKDGSQLLRVMTFTLGANEEKTLTLAQREIPAERLIDHIRLPETRLHTLDGAEKTLSELAGERRALVVWLAVTREPTEHILNELYEQHDAFARLETPLYVVLRAPEELNDPTLRRTMQALPALTPLLCSDEAQRDALSQCVGQEKGKLPLALVVQSGPECLYSEAGYRVGLADLLLKVLRV